MSDYEEEPETPAPPPFRRGVVRPVECLRAGWELIRSDYWLFLGISFVGVLLGSLAPMALLMGPAMCGIYYCYLRKARGKRVSFDMLFRGFDYFLQSFIATLFLVIPTLIVVVPCYILLIVAAVSSAPPPGQKPDPNAGLNVLIAIGVFGVVMLVFSVLLSVFFAFTYKLIVDRGLSGVQAVGTSFRAAAGNFGGVLGLVLLNMLLSLVGVLACYVGAIFVMPLTLAATVIAYKQVFPDEYEQGELPEGGTDADLRPEGD